MAALYIQASGTDTDTDTDTHTQAHKSLSLLTLFEGCGYIRAFLGSRCSAAMTLRVIPRNKALHTHTHTKMCVCVCAVLVVFFLMLSL